MKKFNIYSKNSHEEFLQMLKQQLTNVKNSSNDELLLEIQINSNNEFNEFINLLAVYLNYVLIQQLENSLSNNNKESVMSLNLELSEDILFNNIHLIKIILLEYFKNNTFLHLESFLKFNGNGVFKDLLTLSTDVKQLTDTIENNKDTSSLTPYITSKDILLILKQLLDTSNVDKTHEYNTDLIHISFKNSIVIKDRNNKQIIDHLEDILSKDAMSTIKNSHQTIKITTLIVLSVILLNTNTITFHTSIDTTTKNNIIALLVEISEEYPILKEKEYLSCKGCNLC